MRRAADARGLILSGASGPHSQTAILASGRSFLQRHWGAGDLRRGHVLLRRGRGPDPPAWRGQRPDAAWPARFLRGSPPASPPSRISAWANTSPSRDAPDPLLLRALASAISPASSRRYRAFSPPNASASKPCSNCRMRTSWICLRHHARTHYEESVRQAAAEMSQLDFCWNRRWCCRWSRLCKGVHGQFSRTTCRWVPGTEDRRLS